MRFPKTPIPANLRHRPEAYSASGFRLVAAKLAKRGARKIIIGALTLYHCLRDPETPAWAKSVIIGALGYLVFPMDFIPDAIPGAGFTDDWSVILGAIATVAAHIKADHRTKAVTQTESMLGAEGESDPHKSGILPNDA